MYSENTIVVRGDWKRIWELASQIEKWPERLPHYRRVEMQYRSEDGLEKQAAMFARRDWLPVSWRTIQRLEPAEDPAQARIFFKHTGGVTKGMEVYWSFESLGNDRYRITISHEWKPRWPLVGGIMSEIIDRLVIKNVAGKTLRRVRELAASAATRQKEAVI